MLKQEALVIIHEKVSAMLNAGDNKSEFLENTMQEILDLIDAL